mmetsp:Transcript_2436/g.6538  ORF Transcript_2436/g.6538 Transcript_2436/m.6538 type:complete len:216 (+) Transcript_2436:1183-1830(+)
MTTVLDRFARKKTFYLLHCRLRGTDDEHGPKRSIGGDTARGAAPVAGNQKGIRCFGAKRKKKGSVHRSHTHTHRFSEISLSFLFCSVTILSFSNGFRPDRCNFSAKSVAARLRRGGLPFFLPILPFLGFFPSGDGLASLVAVVASFLPARVSRALVCLSSLYRQRKTTQSKRKIKKRTQNTVPKKNIQKRNETAAVGEWLSRGRIRCSLICKPLV